MTTNFLVYSN